MEDIEIQKNTLASLEKILSTYKWGITKLNERYILESNKLELGSIIEHTEGEYKGAIGIIIGILNNHFYVRYINNVHSGYILPSPYRTMSYKEMTDKLKIKTIDNDYGKRNTF